MRRDLQLYLVRHGVAEERGDAWPDDSKRPLTESGANRLRRSGRGLLALDLTFDVVLSSPLTRARQTAEILAEAFSSPPPIIIVEALSPGGAQAAVLAEIEKQARRERVALVGHEPSLGELAGRLMGLRHPLEFKKGAIARIDVDAGSPATLGRLRWLLPPKVLRTLGK
jgi:phosphohistidine phosphatase